MTSAPENKQAGWGQAVAKGSFAVYLLAIFFGTSLPFSDTITDVADKTTENAVNRIVFSLLFLTSGFCLALNWKKALQFFRREKFLFAFLAWCLLSVGWSQYPGVTFKRAFQIVTGVMVILAMLLYVQSSGELMKYFEGILWVYLPLSLLSVAVVPGALDPLFMTWRALAPSKNHLGQVAVVAILLSVLGARSDRHRSRLVSILMLASSVALLVGSQSMTSILTLCAVAALGGCFFINSWLMPREIAVPYTALALMVVVGIAIAVFTVWQSALPAVTAMFGKDPTFSGRTDLWREILQGASDHLTVGSGFAGFWVVDNPDVLWLYQDFVWLPNQAHMGYLDLLNETGMVGLFLIGLMIVFFFKNRFKLKERHFWQWFVVSALLSNLQETTLFRPNFVTGIMFVFAYMAMYADLMREESVEAVAPVKTTATGFEEGWLSANPEIIACNAAGGSPENPEARQERAPQRLPEGGGRKRQGNRWAVGTA